MHLDTLQAIAAQCQGMDLTAHIRTHQPESQAMYQATGGRGYSVVNDGVAVLQVHGALMKFRSSLGTSCSTIQLRRQLRAALNDQTVKAILLHIDSPGGTVAGTFDLVSDIREATAQKPIWSYIEDLGASGAYAVASPTQRIYANPTALVGSIGTYAVIQDLSGRAEKLGVKVHVVRPDDGTSEFKGAGAPGTEITADQLADWQRIVTNHNGFFLREVSQGRGLGMSQAKTLATGQVWIAAEAKTKRLIDGVQSLDETISKMRNAKSTTKPAASTARAVSPSGRAGSPQIDAPPNSTINEGRNQMSKSPKHEFQDEVRRLIQSGMSRDKAVIEVIRRRPELQREMLVHANQGRPHALKHLEQQQATATGPSAAAQFRAKVSELEKQGLKSAAAVKEVMRSDRDLYLAMLKEVNKNRPNAHLPT